MSSGYAYEFAQIEGWLVKGFVNLKFLLIFFAFKLSGALFFHIFPMCATVASDVCTVVILGTMSVSPGRF